MSNASSSAAVDDEIDLDIDLSVKTKASWIGPLTYNPSTGPTIYAMFNNSIWAFMLAYGVTGRLRPAGAIGFLVMPATALLWVREATRDYERWEGSRALRERRLPKYVLPRTIFDWTDFAYAEECKRLPTG